MAAQITYDSEDETLVRLDEFDRFDQYLKKTLNKLKTSNIKLLNTILRFIKNDSGSIADELYEKYKGVAHSGTMIFDTNGKNLTVKEYFKIMNNVYENELSCLESVTNTRVAQLYVFNSILALYKVIFVDDIAYFKRFLKYVLQYVEHKQEGNICVMDGTHERLSDDFFKNIVVGSFLAIGMLYSDTCRQFNTLIVKARESGSSKSTIKELRTLYNSNCGFFNEIDTRSFQGMVEQKLGIISGGRKLAKGRKTRRQISKRRKSRSNNRKRTLRRKKRVSSN